MNLLKKLPGKFSLTGTEVKVILILIFTLLAGSILRTFFKSQKTTDPRNYNYSNQDSLFNAAGVNSSTADKNDNYKEVDYKAEVLDFSKRSSETDVKKVIPAEKSININTAGISLLSNLPGIGIKTAQNIIRFRETKGRIKNIDELLEVKGIGKSKLDKISKYLFID